MGRRKRGRKPNKGPEINLNLVQPHLSLMSQQALNNDLIKIETNNFHQPTDINYRGKHLHC